MIPERFRTIWGTRTFSTPCATRRWRRTDLKTSGRIKCSAGYGVGSEILRKSKCKNHRNNACKVTFKGLEQNPPCERNGVIMGKELSLKPCQCGQDTDQEVPMRTPKRLYVQERIIYQPELLTCLHCGDLLVTCNYLAWDKTVQTLEHVLSIATRPGRCPHAAC